MANEGEGAKLPFWVKIAPLCVFLAVWEAYARLSQHGAFFFGSPYSVARCLVAGVLDGSFLWAMAVTLFEAVLGFVIGNLVGTVVGLGLWYYPRVARVSRPYVVALSSIPIFAIAPIVVVWFGIGIKSKVILAAVSTLAVATFQAFEGAAQTDVRLLEMVTSMGASRVMAFRKVVVPSSLFWLFAGFRINVGFALLGAFIGEFISSEAGLGYMIIRAMGLYNIPVVLAGVVGICFLAFVLVTLVGWLQSLFSPWQRSPL